MSTIFSRNWRLIALILGIIGFFLLLYLMRTAVLPFVVGLVLAYLFVPVVNWLEAKFPKPGRWMAFKRVLAIIIVFLLLLFLAAVFFYFIITAVIDASVQLATSAPYYISAGLRQIQEWLDVLRDLLPPEIRQEVDLAILEGGIELGNAIRNAVVRGIGMVPSTANFLLGVAALPLFLFYTMKDSERLKRNLYSAFSPAVANHIKNLVWIVERVLGRYIRAQLMLGLIVAYFAFIGLVILKIPFSPVLAILAGIGELIPTLGPWISGGVVAIIALAVAPEKVLWVIVLFLSIQLLENSLLVPRIQGGYLRIHPAVMIFLLVIGAYLAGFWGLILAGPLTATGVEIYRYIRCCYTDETIAEPPLE
jgi:predicted PurR-regulated permease PerM